MLWRLLVLLARLRPQFRAALSHMELPVRPFRRYLCGAVGYTVLRLGVGYTVFWDTVKREGGREGGREGKNV